MLATAGRLKPAKAEIVNSAHKINLSRQLRVRTLLVPLPIPSFYPPAKSRGQRSINPPLRLPAGVKAG
jgi:hypothetical protein